MTMDESKADRERNETGDWDRIYTERAAERWMLKNEAKILERERKVHESWVIVHQVVAEVQAEIERLKSACREARNKYDRLTAEHERMVGLKGRIEDVIRGAEKQDE